jgi:hypothetical protein
MSKASELAELASLINVTPRGGIIGANTITGLDSFSTQKIVVTNDSAGNTEFDGGNTAYPAIELLSGAMSLTSKYTPSIKFGSTDPQFVTQNPKYGAAIVAEATQNYASDTNGGMALSFWTSPINPGVQTSLRKRLTIDNGGQITVNNSGFLSWSNAQFLFATAGQGQGARIGKFSDDHLYIENFDDKDIIFRNEARPAGVMATMYGANGSTRFYNSANVTQSLGVDVDATINQNLYVNQDLYFNSGYGSAAKAYGCRAWVSFNGQSNPLVIAKSGNVSSLTDNGVGMYTINFEESMPDIYYVVAGSGAGAINNLFSIVPSDSLTRRTVNNVRFSVTFANGTAAFDCLSVDVVIFR